MKITALHKRPTVSVIITIYNRAHTLVRAVDSVMAQSVEDWELILVDDGSQDNSVELAMKIASGDQRVSVIVNSENRGIGGAKNVGIRAARGRYVAFLDSDDAWHADKLALQIHHITEPGSSPLCFTGFYVVREGRNDELRRIPKRDGTWIKTAAQGLDVALGSTLLAHRELFDEIGGFDETIRRMEDRDWIIRYLCAHHEFDIVPEPLAWIYTGSFPQAQHIRDSARELVRLNSPRLEPFGSELPNTFASALAFDAAVAEYRSGHRVTGVISALAAMWSSPGVAMSNGRRFLRKISDRDFY